MWKIDIAILYYIKIKNKKQLETSNYYIAISKSSNLEEHLQKDLPTSPMKHM